MEAGHARLLEARLPAGVRDSMRDRLARLSEPAQEAALVASIFSPALWVVLVRAFARSASISGFVRAFQTCLRISMDKSVAATYSA